MDDLEKAKLLERIDILQKDSQALREEINALLGIIQLLENRISDLQAPPNQICIVKEVCVEKKQAVIMNSYGVYYVVNIDPGLNAEHLMVGQEVLINSGMNIVAFRKISLSQKSKDKKDRLEEVELTEVPDVTFDQIGGLKATISKINDAIELPYRYPGLFHKNEYEIPKGILLYGPPGCGKTMLGKAIANQLSKRLQVSKGLSSAHCAFLYVSGPSLVDKYVGESEKNIRKLFKKARKIAKKFPDVPVIIFIDEIDALLPLRDSGTSGVSARTIPQFTSEFDGIKALDGVIVVATTNRQDLIDAAVLRRFQTKIKVDRPNEKAVRAILTKYLTKDLFFDKKYFVDSHTTGEQFSELNSDSKSIANYLIDETIKKIFDHRNDKKSLQLIFRNGETKTLHFSDLISGAIIKDIVNRVKLLSIKAEIADDAAGGISKEHLLTVIEQKYEETFSALEHISLPDKWVKTNGIDTDSRIVVNVRIISPEEKNNSKQVGFKF